MKRAVLSAIRGYRVLISPMFPPSCRYWPTCSAYAAEAVERHGVLYGGWLSVRRLLRCHPWGSHGFDPVPEHRHGSCSHDSSRPALHAGLTEDAP